MPGDGLGCGCGYHHLPRVRVRVCDGHCVLAPARPPHPARRPQFQSHLVVSWKEQALVLGSGKGFILVEVVGWLVAEVNVGLVG